MSGDREDDALSKALRPLLWCAVAALVVVGVAVGLIAQCHR